MATITKTIGTSSTIDTETPSSCSGSNPYTVTFTNDPSGVVVGDKVYITDEASYYDTFIYNVTGISGSSYTLTYSSGGYGAESPCSLYNSFYEQAAAVFKRELDYATPQDWINDFNDTSIYSAGDDVIGELSVNEKYDQGLGLTCDQSNHTLGSITLTVAESVRHNGTAGSGAGLRFTSSGAQSAYSQWVYVESSNITIEWLEWDGTGASSSAIAQHFFSTVENDVGNIHLKNNLMYGLDQKGGGIATRAIRLETPSDTVTATCSILNNILYDIDPSTPSGGDCTGIYAIGGRAENAIYVYNNTVHHIVGTGTASGLLGYGRGIHSSSHTYVTNNIVSDVTAPVTADDFYGNEHADSDYNLSTDTTAPGSNSVTSATLADIYESATGTINLHLKSGSPAIDAGTDLGTSPTGVNIDIDGRNRDSEGDTWDIGADEYVVNGIEVAPTAAALEAAAVSPTAVQASLSITPAASAADADATLTGAALGSVTVTPSTASAVLAGVSPTVDIPNVEVTPAAASLTANATLSGVQAGSISITPAVASLEAATVSPPVSLGSVSVTPSQAVCTAAAVSPSVIIVIPSVTVTPTAASFVAVAISPTTSSGSLTVTPTAAASALAAATPSVVQSNMTLTPSAAAITTAASATASQDSLALTPSVATAVVTAVSPTVVRGSITVAPTAAAATTSVSYRALVFGSMVVVVPESAKAVYTSQNPTLAFGSTTANPTAASFVATASATASEDSFTITPAAAVVVTDVTSPTILAGVTATPAPAGIELSCPPITLVITFDSAALGYWVDGRPDYKVGGKVDYSIDGRPDYEIGDLL